MEEKRKNQCVVEGCELDKYEGHDECILHFNKNPKYCKKLSDNFISALLIYINFYQSTIIAIKFPPLDYIHIDSLLSLNIASFNYTNCSFYNFEFTTNSKFVNCNFSANTIIEASSSNISHFDNCVFEENLKIINSKDLNNIHKLPFSNCTFNKSITLTHLTLSFLPQNNYEFGLLVFENCTFIEDHLLLDYRSMIFFDCTFTGDITFAHNSIQSLSFLNCTFNKDCLFFALENIKNFNMTSTRFLSSTAFSNSTFTCTPYIDKTQFHGILTFNSCSLKSGIQINYSTFYLGLNLIKTAVPYNHPAHKKTSQETYRIIKHSFDSIGNTIEANKYFALEMDKAYSELTWTEQPKDKFLLFVNKVTSNYGQNWLLPVFWIFIFSSAFLYIKSAHSNGYLSGLDTNPFLMFLNALAGVITPLNSFLKKGMEFISLVFGIIFTILIYQTIVALKRKTRR